MKSSPQLSATREQPAAMKPHHDQRWSRYNHFFKVLIAKTCGLISQNVDFLFSRDILSDVITQIDDTQ